MSTLEPEPHVTSSLPPCDDWRLSTKELETVMKHDKFGGGLAENTCLIFAHRPNGTLIQRLQKIESGAIAGRDALVVFCDGQHYRVIFASERVWFAFDSLDTHHVFSDELYKILALHSPRHEYVQIRLKLQSDTVNCGVWALWAIQQWLEFKDYWADEPKAEKFDDFLKTRARRDNLSCLRAGYPTALYQSTANEDFVHRLKRTYRRDYIPRTECPEVEMNRLTDQRVADKKQRVENGTDVKGGESKGEGAIHVEVEEDSQETHWVNGGAVDLSKRLSLRKMYRPTQNNPSQSKYASMVASEAFYTP